MRALSHAQVLDAKCHSRDTAMAAQHARAVCKLAVQQARAAHSDCNTLQDAYNALEAAIKCQGDANADIAQLSQLRAAAADSQLAAVIQDKEMSKLQQQVRTSNCYIGLTVHDCASL